MTGQFKPRGVVEIELDLHRLTVDEAMPLLHDYLNEACLAGMRQVRIVHGKGSGAIRQAVVRELKGHPVVRSYRPGGKGEGGDGATVVDL